MAGGAHCLVEIGIRRRRVWLRVLRQVHGLHGVRSRDEVSPKLIRDEGGKRCKHASDREETLVEGEIRRPLFLARFGASRVPEASARPPDVPVREIVYELSDAP